MLSTLMDDTNRRYLDQVIYLVGDKMTVEQMESVPVKQPFDTDVLAFLDAVSKILMKMPIKNYPDIVTFAFWIRKTSTLKLKERFLKNPQGIYWGKGIAFHIAPSNIAVNYAYSLAVGLLTGNANIVRLPSKDFDQIVLINEAFGKALTDYPQLKPYLCLIRYQRNTALNNLFSALANIRIIWGGDKTIQEIRKSPLRPRAGEITFADRYSLAVIQTEAYLALKDKESFARTFYNDTFLTDQNACSSPRLIVWLGKEKEKAQEQFWRFLHSYVKNNYILQPITAVNKLASSFLVAARYPFVKIEPSEDNYIVRIKLTQIDSSLMDLKENSGYFFEYDCDNLMPLKEICNDLRCQTIGFYGEKNQILPLLFSGIKGVDRIVPIGKTMDFDMIWDGYNLFEHLTRLIKIEI